MLAMQGVDDSCGSMEQTQDPEIAQRGHTPHHDQPQIVLEAIAALMHRGIRLGRCATPGLA